jgi:hypothetical protein
MLKDVLHAFRSNYHPELSVRGYTSINSIQRRTVTTCLNTDQVMFKSAGVSQALTSERGAKNANCKLEYEYFRLQKNLKDVLESYLRERENHLLFGEN